MTAVALKPGRGARPAASAGFPAWLDALASGAVTEDEVVAHVQRLEETSGDAVWECLAQLDQHFRRKRLGEQLFISLKGRLQQHSLGMKMPARPPAAVTKAKQTAASSPPSPEVVAHVSALAVEARTDVTSRPPRVGDVLRGRYRLVDLIGEDEAGTLYEALDELNLGVPGARPRVAVRVISSDPSRLPERLRRLARVQSLSHPGIARVFNVDEEHGVVFVTMELPAGPSLRQLLDQNRAPLAQPAALTAVRSIAAALAYAHSQGVHHGDVRAEHVFIGRSGEARLAGFEKNDAAAASVDGDRLAFAWFAYGLLSGKPGALRAPRGLTGAQWRALRDTLTGRKGDRAASLLTLMAAEDGASGAAARASTDAPRRQLVVNGWAVVIIVAILFAVAGAFILRENVERVPNQTVPAAAESPPPASAVQDVAVVPASMPDPPSRPEPAPVESAAPAMAATAPAAAPPAAPAAPVFTHARMYFPTNFVEVPADESVARLWVRRQGRMSGAASFRWWTESGTAQVDRHFRRVAPRIAEIPGGARGVELLVPLVPGMRLDRPRTFYVRIDEPDARSMLGDEVLMQVVIVPPAGVAAR